MMRRTAFTLIELLLAIAIIAALAAMLVVAGRLVLEAAKRSRSENILAILGQAAGLHGTERGAPPAPAEHPLAWSADRRLAFIGRRGRTVDAAGTIDTSAWNWQTLSATGEAIAGPLDYEIETDTSRYPSGSADRTAILSRLLDPDDIFLGGATAGSIDAPALVGVPRRWLGTVGAPIGSEPKPTAPVTSSDGRLRWLHPAPIWGTRYRKIPRPTPPVTSARLAPPPYDYRAYTANWTASWKYPDQEHVIQGWNDAGATRSVVDWMLSAGGLLDELRSLGAIHEPADDTTLTAGSRFWSDDAGATAWSPGLLRTDLNGSGSWRRYRLRHFGFYDAWGGEILYFLADDANPVFLSAGKDRAFRIDPGLNRILDTDPASASFLADGTLAGDDRDGRTDNITFHEAGTR